jgi:hypothetical protein
MFQPVTWARSELGYLEALLRAADCRASQEEDERERETP